MTGLENLACERYASSLFEVAEENGCAKEIYEEISLVKRTFSDNPEFLKLLSSPAVSIDDKLSMTEDIFSFVGKYTVNFIKLLCEKRRISEFYDIFEVFENIYFDRNNIRRVHITTAVPLSPSMKQKLVNKLSAVTNARILLYDEVDPSILGGVVMRIDNEQTDSSVKTNLELIKKQLSAIIA